MTALIRIRDESATGKVLAELALELASERTSVRELITSRVRHEVEQLNRSPADGVFHSLVQPRGAEPALNGYKLKTRRRIDADEQVALALEAFSTNGFFIVIDDRQVEELDLMVQVSPETKVSFVKLVPLVGG